MSCNYKTRNLTLGIETSCDETAIGLYGDDGLVDHIVYSQIKTHQPYGGVVPELASREHLSKIDALTESFLKKNEINLSDLSYIAYTKGPGLIGALLVGANYALGLSKGLNIPLIGVNHLEAHIASAFINQDFPNKPFLTLLISGGHSQIIYTHKLGQYELIGETLDDAVGEAFDKTAKIMGLTYPGGPIIEELALKATETILLPKPMMHSKNAMMSFSGLKTATRLAYEKRQDAPNIKANIAKSLQDSICAVLTHKISHAIDQTKATHLIVSGGVSANQYIRSQFNQLPIEVSFPKLEFCTDNGAMVAYLGYLKRKVISKGALVQSRLPMYD